MKVELRSLRCKAEKSIAKADANNYRTDGEWYFYYAAITAVPDVGKPNTVVNNWPNFGASKTAGRIGVEIYLKVLRQYGCMHCTQICRRSDKDEMWLRSLSALGAWSDWKRAGEQSYCAAMQSMHETIGQKMIISAVAKSHAA